ncbi:unnamed protein product [Dracunculus medinensis]|uniref:Transposase n=1 Tax=Dracunculus medinensis TaxID=318479 RepID=A0A0N4URZ7_DRAME|nr:unnamed protein product [Dracunculus medinensis]
MIANNLCENFWKISQVKGFGVIRGKECAAAFTDKYRSSSGVTKRGIARLPRIIEAIFHAELNEKYVMKKEKLYDNGFPVWKSSNKTIVDIAPNRFSYKMKAYAEETGSPYFSAVF